MARVFGIDLGAHSLKVAELELGFRSMQLKALRTISVPFGPQPALERSLAVLPELDAGPQDLVSVAVPGDRVLFRLLGIPPVDPKRLLAIVGNELADDIPWELEDLVFDYFPMGGRQRVLAAAARSQEIAELLARLEGRGVVVRQLPPATLGYGALGRRLFSEGATLLLDLGHVRTNVCLLVDGKPTYARTISRGGLQITERLRQLFQLSHQEAEQFKHTHALVVNNPDALDAASRRIALATAEAITPLVREIKRTAAVCSGRLGVDTPEVVLCGGTSLLNGLAEYLAVELDRPVGRVPLELDPDLAEAGLSMEGQSIAALSVSLGLDAGRRPPIDLRQGEFAFKTDQSVFREKIAALAISALLVVIFAAGSGWAAMYAADKESERLEAELSRVTRGVFGKAEIDPWRVSKKIKSGSRMKKGGVPQHTAVELLTEMSKRMPGKDTIELDLTRLDIKPGKTYIRGTAESRSSIGKVVKALKEYDCFKDVSSGKISEVAGGKKQFSLTIASKCF